MTEKIDKTKYFYGTGRRKTSVARVRLYHGEGISLINSKEKVLTKDSVAPLELVGKSDSTHLTIMVSGGGFSSQVMAIRHGISRALILMNPEYRSTLKKAGFLTRDAREVERKKPGLKKARRAPQWSKR